MSTISLNHTYHTHCLRLAPARTHIPTSEMGNSKQYLMQVLCRWDVVLCLEYRAFEVVDSCIDAG